jgi:hypothetical protein
VTGPRVIVTGTGSTRGVRYGFPLRIAKYDYQEDALTVERR